jgi:hypothetical protein
MYDALVKWLVYQAPRLLRRERRRRGLRDPGRGDDHARARDEVPDVTLGFSDLKYFFRPENTLYCEQQIQVHVAPRGSRGWQGKYRYAPHGLRFDVKRPTETVDDFRRRQ